MKVRIVESTKQSSLKRVCAYARVSSAVMPKATRSRIKLPITNN